MIPKHIILSTILFILLPQVSHGQESEEKKEGWISYFQSDRSSRQNREESILSVQYTPLSLGTIFPKTGFSAAWNISANVAIEPEYLSGGYSLKLSKIQLGEFKESLFLLPIRWYPNTNSFNLRFGVGYRQYELTVGDDTLAAIIEATDLSQEDLSEASLVKVDNIIINLGIGNRWQFDNGIVLGVDWIDLFVTVGQGNLEESLLQSSDDGTKDNLKNLYSLLRYAPSITLAKVQIGYAF